MLLLLLLFYCLLETCKFRLGSSGLRRRPEWQVGTTSVEECTVPSEVTFKILVTMYQTKQSHNPDCKPLHQLQNKISREVWLHVFPDPLNRNEPEECCNRPAHLKNPYCLEIHIPADDYFYSLFGLRCQDFVRGFPAVRPGCRLGNEPNDISFVRFIISITILTCPFMNARFTKTERP